MPTTTRTLEVAVGSPGLGPDGRGYVIADRTVQGRDPATWARAAVAAWRDLEADRDERAGELARAAEAMTHVPEHLANAGEAPERPAARGVLDPPPDPKAERRDRERGLPPRLP